MLDIQFDYQSFLRQAPTQAGVYLMKNAQQHIIYVGKAKQLKQRLSSYFHKNNVSPKTQVLRTHIHSIEIIITANENDALLLENNLIKLHKPRYNVRLIDDKSYPYLHISAHAYPRLQLYRGQRQVKGELFGPYPSSLAVQETLEVIAKVFKIRQCDDVFFSHRSRPCLQYQIKRCSAPCTHFISQEDYQENIAHVRSFLAGKSEGVIQQLILQMNTAAAQQLYEKAAQYRDQIRYIQHIQQQNAIEGKMRSVDVFAVVLHSGIACVALLSFRDGRLLGTNTYFPIIDSRETVDDIIIPFLSQYYHSQRLPPDVIVLKQAVKATDCLHTYLATLRQRKISIRAAVRAETIRWYQMAEKNAEQALSIKLSAQASIDERIADLQHLLACNKPIERIECFDISHSLGECTVASNVVFTPHGWEKSQYRRFNIEGIQRGDDYAAMHQALVRRFQQQALPDILLIDGGKAQLKVAIEVVTTLCSQPMLILAIAKGEGRKAGLEKVWCAGELDPLILDSHRPAFHLLTQIRDEAHRFAITGHRVQRNKARYQSPLDQIPGIGEKRKMALIQHFGGLMALKKADIEAIARVPSFSKSLAKRIYAHFHPNESILGLSHIRHDERED